LTDVENYYTTYLTSNKTKIVIVGDVTEEVIMPKLFFLNQLPNNNLPIENPTLNYKDEKTIIYLVDVPKAAQTEFTIVKAVNMKYDLIGEYYQSDLMNYVLGGNFNSRLNLNLREDKGWTYGARSSFSGDKYGIDFIFSSGIKASATDSALSEVLKEMDNYSKNGITTDEIIFMKSALGQRDALQYETPGQKSGFVSKLLEYNLEGSFIKSQNNILKNISKAQIDELAKKWIQSNKMNILLVGDKEKILPGLKKFGFDIVELDSDGNMKL